MALDNIILFEPYAADDYYPFSIMHCVWEMRCGIMKIFEKYENFFSTPLWYNGRDAHISSFLARHNKENGHLVNGGALALTSAFLPTFEILEKITQSIDAAPTRAIVFIGEGKIIAAYYPNFYPELLPMLRDFDPELLVNPLQIDLNGVKFLNYLWDTIDLNGNAIIDDINRLEYDFRILQDIPQGVTAINPENIYLGENVKLSPSCVIDASDGPVIIDSGTKIMPMATILGPAYIGKKNVIKIGAKIYENCTFGEHCKVGGELEGTIIHAYSNKQHEGFLGHSYLCEWVNLGADTNNSDLKNTYSPIKMRLRDKEVDTPKIFLGLMCGDHTKSGINSMFTTGTTAGICGILVREWFMPNHIPSFSWGGAKDSPAYKVSKAIETAKIVMSRRGKSLLPEEIFLMEEEYKKVRG